MKRKVTNVKTERKKGKTNGVAMGQNNGEKNPLRLLPKKKTSCTLSGEPRQMVTKAVKEWEGVKEIGVGG
jgi:hypothetical protein